MTIPDEHLPLILEALQFRADYLRARERDSRPQLELIDMLKRKPVAKEEALAPAKRKRA